MLTWIFIGELKIFFVFFSERGGGLEVEGICLVLGLVLGEGECQV